MRAILLLAIVGILCMVALVRPKLGIFAYTWFALMRPDYLAWAAGVYPYSQMLAFSALAGSLVFMIPRLHSIFTSSIMLGLIGFQVFNVLSIIFSINPDLCLEPFDLYARMLLMAFLVVPAVETLDDLKWLIVLMAVSLGLIGAKFGLGGLLGGGARIGQGYGGMLADNNVLALAMAMAVPLCWYGAGMLQARWAKAAVLALGAFSLIGIVWTHSRGGFLAAVCGIGVIALHSKRKMLILILALLVFAPAVYLVRDSYVERLSTLKAPTEESSASSRIRLLKSAIAVWREHPVFGVGFGSRVFQQITLERGLASRTGFVAHNTYLQVLVDSGAMALAYYLGLLFGTIWWLGRSAKQIIRIRSDLVAYPYALQATLVVFAVGSTFLSRILFDTFYIVLAAAGAWQNVARPMLASMQPGVVSIAQAPAMPAMLPATVPPVLMPPAPPTGAPPETAPRRRPHLRYGER